MINQLSNTTGNSLIVITILIIINWFLLSSNISAQPIDNSRREQQVFQSIELNTNLILENANPVEKQQLKDKKYAQMQESEFAFYRATNHLFWQDFANDSRLSKFGNPNTKTWILGDCHVDNFGAYNNDQGEIIFDMNDFDESIIADYQYDLWRLATSIILVANDSTLSKSEQEEVVDSLSETYLDTLASYVGNDEETKIYFTEANTKGEIKRTIEKAAQKTRQGMLYKWTKVIDNQRMFDFSSEKLGLATDAKKAIQSRMLDYGKTLSGNLNYDPEYFKVKDVAQRLNAGLGSLGTPRYYVLIEGKTDALDDDHILDIKHQFQPAPTDELFSLYDRINYWKIFNNSAQRHALAYKALIKDADDFLGWIKLVDNNPIDGDFSGDYSVREISPYKKSLKIKNLIDKNSFIEVAQQWGKILATNHARADKDFDKKLVSTSFEKQVKKITDGKHQEFRKLVREIAFKYAQQVEADYDNFVTEEIGNKGSRGVGE
ncbi:MULTISPECIES: DUF2252 domain-containing protein [unclassified Okeania]|uniref:DUF2252 domain-containing protein n=1 Tax=unclassified Okeania TaxID=2634635 RepID=UPI0013BBF6AF|nr:MULTISPECIES: DUF2252 domain-containing protein [unclassified Okeania]NES75626.1 DUF2252 domain-containing protein [Okeania sp. SIO1H4]NET19029.1 DUF2252 domain-containing protein [Okeania sp. SIO1H5]NET91897.1 DUF2252 domain-containing protein [Okeania sp. SIO1H2]